jgi:hypothetical protein
MIAKGFEAGRRRGWFDQLQLIKWVDRSPAVVTARERRTPVSLFWAMFVFAEEHPA